MAPRPLLTETLDPAAAVLAAKLPSLPTTELSPLPPNSTSASSTTTTTTTNNKTSFNSSSEVASSQPIVIKASLVHKPLEGLIHNNSPSHPAFVMADEYDPSKSDTEQSTFRHTSPDNLKDYRIILSVFFSSIVIIIITVFFCSKFKQRRERKRQIKLQQHQSPAISLSLPMHYGGSGSGAVVAGSVKERLDLRAQHLNRSIF